MITGWTDALAPGMHRIELPWAHALPQPEKIGEMHTTDRRMLPVDLILHALRLIIVDISSLVSS